MSRRPKDEYHRHYTVTEPRLHPKGYTEYRVTAKFVSKTNPEDVKEIGVWKRYSDFKKLHGDLAYVHRNLFRRLEDFPAFPKAQVFGRFEPEVIEERRKAAEAMLRFTVHIPALNNSPQLKEFFQGGEVRQPLEACDLPVLQPPLIPIPLAGGDPVSDARGLAEEPAPCGPEAVGDAERLAAGEQDGSTQEGEETGDPALIASCEEALDVLFAFAGETEKEEEEGSPPRDPLSVQEMALFDPFVKDDPSSTSPSLRDELAFLAVGSGSEASPPSQDSASWELQPGPAGAPKLDPGAYLTLATEQITRALEREAAKDYAGALRGYRNGVDILLQGLPGDPDPVRQEAVKKKTAEYLERAEELCRSPQP
uniref:Sorting nexin-15 n=1 Tax=Sphenodon punctatus TaxID=8508 RepID=A0A8D0GBA2_SPHPU